MKRASAALLLAILGTAVHGKDESALKNVPALVILQRTPRVQGLDDALRDTSYQPGGRLVKLSPPSADGTVTVLCCSQFAGFEAADIQSYDISFDARSIVFSGRPSGNDRYSLYILQLNDHGEAAGVPENLTIDPNFDFVYPVFAPGQRIIFIINKNVEGDEVPQVTPGSVRGATSQLGLVTVTGTDLVLGPRNLSHRAFPTMLTDGRVLFSEVRPGDNDAAQLRAINPDFTQLREIFGGAGSSPCTSVVKAQEVDPGRIVALCSSRDRTIQAGKILDIQLGKHIDGIRTSAAFPSFRDLTPPPAGRDSSAPDAGRYYDVVPIPGDAGRNSDDLFLLVSWARSPVEGQMVGAAGLAPDFGIYVYDSRNHLRLPLFNDENMWDVQPRILAARPVPALIESSASNGFSDTAALLGGLSVQRSSAGALPDRAVGVQIIEGFSGEEGFMEFGLTESEGATLLGIARVQSDDSWAALVPANIPVHVQPIDRFGMSVINEPVWISGQPGQSRFYSGWHEDRSWAQIVRPGVMQALAQRPVDLNVGGDQRGFGPIVQHGTPVLPETDPKAYSWIRHVEPALVAAKCNRCHDGTSKIVEGRQANRSLTLTETATGISFRYFFNLGPSMGARSSYGYAFGDRLISTYSASHLGLLGDVPNLEGMGITRTGDLPRLMLPGNFRGSPLANILNPQQLYPFDAHPARRWRPNRPQHPMEFTPETLAAFGNPRALTWDETLILIRVGDFGAQFYTRGDVGNGH